MAYLLLVYTVRKRGSKKTKEKDLFYLFAFVGALLSFALFDIIEDIVEETLCSKWSDNEFFGEFVEVKNLSICDNTY